jgi:hypothetical protein
MKDDEIGETCNTQGGGRGEMQTKFWSENLKGRDNLEQLGVVGG